MQIKTTITGDKQVMAKIKILAEKNIEALKKVMLESTFVVEARAKKKAPVLFGRLKSSITSEVKKDKSGYTGQVGTNVSYAPAVEFGTRPHLAPIGAEAAKKYGFPAGTTVIRVSGKAQPFLFPAFKESGRDIIKFLERAIKGVRI